MGRRSDHTRVELKEMALAAAERIVASEGLKALTARKVAGAIGYTAGTLYLVFPSFGQLIWELNARTLRTLKSALEAAAGSDPDPRGSLLRLGVAYIRYATTHRDLWSLLFEGHRSGEPAPPEWYRPEIGALFRLVEERLTAIASPRSAREIAMAARALWSGVHGISSLALGDRLDLAGVPSIEALARTLIEGFVAGFAVEAPARVQEDPPMRRRRGSAGHPSSA